MYKLTHTVTRELSPAEAESFLTINTFPGQRRLDTQKARRYADGIIDGSMRPVHVGIAALRDSTRVLVNGQHVLTAIALSGKNQLATIETYQCETDEDAWKLFATFDVHGTRTQGHIMKAARGLFSDCRLHDVPLRVLSSCGTALMILGDGTRDPEFHSGAPSKSFQPDLVSRHGDEVVFVNQFDAHKHMMRIGVVAAMVATFRKEPVHAQTFWGRIAEGIGFTSQDDPAYRLRETLLEGLTDKGGSRHRAYYCLSIAWWNSWVTGSRRSIVKLAAMDRIPKVANAPLLKASAA